MGLMENMADAVCNPENEDTYDEEVCAEMSGEGEGEGEEEEEYIFRGSEEEMAAIAEVCDPESEGFDEGDCNE